MGFYDKMDLLTVCNNYLFILYKDIKTSKVKKKDPRYPR